MGTEMIIVLPERTMDDLAKGLVRLTGILADHLGDAAYRGYGFGGENGYGENWSSAVFQMHHYCWCDEEDCPWCCLENDYDKGALNIKTPPHRGAPHFWFKPTGFRVWWYKYIGRGMETHGDPGDLAAMFAACEADVKNTPKQGTTDSPSS